MKALNHILMNTSIYQKPENTKFAIGEILGDGVLVVEGDKHKQQASHLGPTFYQSDDDFIEESHGTIVFFVAVCVH